MMRPIVVTRNVAADNGSIGEDRQEMCIFPDTATLKQVLEWAAPECGQGPTRGQIMITRPLDRSGL